MYGLVLVCACGAQGDPLLRNALQLDDVFARTKQIAKQLLQNEEGGAFKKDE